MKSLLLAICTFLTAAALGQERSQADVSITTVTLNSTGRTRPMIADPSSKGPTIVQPEKTNTRLAPAGDNLKCIITVHNENDDDAYGTILVAVLPVEVSVVQLPPNATVHKSSPNSPFAGYITFNLGQMGVGQNITVEFTFTKSKYGNKVGGYAYSGSPDPNPANNYKEASF